MPPHTRLHCAPRVGLAARAGALGTGAGRFPAVAAQTLGASCCMCLAACGHRLSHLPYAPAKALRTVCRCQTAPAVLCLRDSLLCLFFFSHVMVFYQHLQCRGVSWGDMKCLCGDMRCLTPGKKVQVPGATQPQSPASHLDLALWLGGFALLPSVRPPCPLFSLSSRRCLCEK